MRIESNPKSTFRNPQCLSHLKRFSPHDDAIKNMDESFARLKRFVSSHVFLAFLLTAISITAYYSVALFSRLDLSGRDSFLQLRYAFRKPPAEARDILLVAIDDESTRVRPQKWPWPRSVHGEAVTKIAAFHPKAIGFDFVFQGEEQSPENDEVFRQSLKQAGNVVLAAYKADEGTLISAHPSIEQAAYRTALVNKLLDRDGIVRRAPLYLLDSKSGGIRWSWESEIFFKATGLPNPAMRYDPEKRLVQITSESGTQLVIPAPEGVFDIDYTVDFRDLPSVPFWKLMEDKVDPSLARDKIVLIGLTGLAFHDFHSTPIQKSMPGLALNANVLLALLRQSFWVRVPFIFTWLLLFLSLWLILRSTERYSILLSFFIMAATTAVYLGLSFYLLWHNIVWDLFFIAVVGGITFFGAVLYKQFLTALENIRLREESVRDPLTGFYTRRFLEVHLRLDVKKVLSTSRSFGVIDEVSVMMIDLDNFKLVNDSFGHQEGDRVLKRLGESIRSSVRKNELVCRYGGDEFAVILPGTSLQNAVQLAEKLRLLIANDPELSYTTQAGVRTFCVTGSFGVASVKGARAMTPENLLKAADRALYRAKKGGRNQVCSYDPERDVIEGK